ncbi:MAG: RDD family protein [Nitrospirota bacterium]
MDAVPHTSSEPSADHLTRWVAKLIDLLVAAAMDRLIPSVGFFVAVTYLLIADALRPWGSAGKSLLGMAVRGPEGRECGVRESILRNWVVAMPFAVWAVCQRGGWLAGIVGWIGLVAALGAEGVLLVGNPQGRRLGDELADTRVVQLRVTRNA